MLRELRLKQVEIEQVGPRFVTVLALDTAAAAEVCPLHQPQAKA